MVEVDWGLHVLKNMKSRIRTLISDFFGRLSEMSTLISDFVGGLGGICSLILKLHVITESKFELISVGEGGGVNHDYVMDSSKRGGFAIIVFDYDGGRG